MRDASRRVLALVRWSLNPPRPVTYRQQWLILGIGAAVMWPPTLIAVAVLNVVLPS